MSECGDNFTINLSPSLLLEIPDNIDQVSLCAALHEPPSLQEIDALNSAYERMIEKGFVFSHELSDDSLSHLTTMIFRRF